MTTTKQKPTSHGVIKHITIEYVRLLDERGEEFIIMVVYCHYGAEVYGRIGFSLN